jgi:hypothetical protein
MLKNQHDKVRSTLAPVSKKFVLCLSEYVLTDSEESVLLKGLNFAIANPHSNLDMACAVESVVSKLPHTLRMQCTATLDQHTYIKNLNVFKQF